MFEESYEDPERILNGFYGSSTRVWENLVTRNFGLDSRLARLLVNPRNPGDVKMG